MKGFLISLTTLTVGALLGAGLALLYAPRAGRTTRAMLYTKGRLLKDDVQQELAVARKQVKGGVRRVTRTTRDVRATVEDLGERLQDAVEHPRATVREAVEALPIRTNGH